MAGRWESVISPWGPTTLGYQAVHMIHLRTGKFLVCNLQSQWGVWDPADEPNVVMTDFPPNTAYCSGHAAFSDGDVLVAAGLFVDQAWRVNPTGFPSMALLAPMLKRRYYPTCMTLYDGRLLVCSGWRSWRVREEMDEVYDPTSGTWELLPDEAWLSRPFYPFTFLLPNGSTFFAGPGRRTRILTTQEAQVSNWVWTDEFLSPPRLVGTGSAVTFEPGKILKAGGVTGETPQAPTDKAALIDFTSTNPQWVEIAPLNKARRNHNLVLLPDGTILCLGGNETFETNGPVLEAELWDPSQFNPNDPTANPWQQLPAMTDPRWYHSVAALLPDARVITAGGELGGAYQEYSAQIYRPGYLDGNPDRPGFSTSDPPSDEMEYGEQYPFKFTHDRQGASISKIALIRLAAVTHAYDQDQRYVPLDFETEANNVLNVAAPPNGFIAPPGYYTLWLVDDQGVPSKAHYIKVKPAP